MGKIIAGLLIVLLGVGVQQALTHRGDVIGTWRTEIEVKNLPDPDIDFVFSDNGTYRIEGAGIIAAAIDAVFSNLVGDRGCLEGTYAVWFSFIVMQCIDEGGQERVFTYRIDSASPQKLVLEMGTEPSWLQVLHKR